MDPLAKVGVFNTPVQVISGKRAWLFVMTTLPAVMELASNMARSWTSGMAGTIAVDPPEVVNQTEADQF